jgi:hypothetical protein
VKTTTIKRITGHLDETTLASLLWWERMAGKKMAAKKMAGKKMEGKRLRESIFFFMYKTAMVVQDL